MSHAEHHRGPDPEDSELFGEGVRCVLLRASEEATYLLDRGYSTESVVDVVSRRHSLRARQSMALRRSMCSSAQRLMRCERRVSPADIGGRSLEIDGFNLIITVEVALSGGLVIRGVDGAYRDLAGLRGSYHMVQETERALGLLGMVFGELGVTRAHFYLDQPVSNSGRLRQQVLSHAEAWASEVEVSLVRDPDRDLCGKELVVSSDARVLDGATSSVNLLEVLVARHIDSCWLMDLSVGAVTVSR